MKTKTDTGLVSRLIEKIKNDSGCPLCSLVMDFEFNELARIQFEVTTDKAARDNIAVRGGFCDFHFRQFKKIASGKTNIRILKSILDTGVYKKKDFKIDCLICKTVDDFESELIKVVNEFLLEPESRTKLEKTDGFCFPHMNDVSNLSKDENLKDWLCKIYIEQIERMKSDFDSMDNVKSYYEIDLKKRKLINILIEKLAGRKTRSM
jgi:hypothetical protein